MREKREKATRGTTGSGKEKEQLGPGLDVYSSEFESVVNRSWGLFYKIAYRILHNHEDAQDAIQDALVHAFQASPRYVEQGKLRAWLCRIVRNRALNMSYRNRNLNFLSLDSSEEGDYFDIIDTRHVVPEVAIARGEVHEQFRKLVFSFPELPRLLLWYRFIQDYDYDEIAELVVQGGYLGKVSPGTLRVQVHRGVEMLRRALELHNLSIGDLEAWGAWSSAFEASLFTRISGQFYPASSFEEMTDEPTDYFT